MKVSFDVTHKVGTVIEGPGRKYTVIGYEYIESRGSRVCLAYGNNGMVEWLWVFPCEIEMLEQKSLTPLSHDNTSIRPRTNSRKRR